MGFLVALLMFGMVKFRLIWLIAVFQLIIMISAIRLVNVEEDGFCRVLNGDFFMVGICLDGDLSMFARHTHSVIEHIGSVLY